MSKLKLTKKEKSRIFDHLWENMFDAGKNDTHYLDPPMVKLLSYLDIKIPQRIPVNCSDGTAYTITLVQNDVGFTDEDIYPCVDEKNHDR